MARFANQVYQVFLVYATRWRFWVVLGVTAPLVLNEIRDLNDTGTRGSEFVIFPCVLMLMLYYETISQFTHFRSKTLPGFNLPHLVIPIAYTLAAAVLIPSLIAFAGAGSALHLTAIASILFGGLLWVSTIDKTLFVLVAFIYFGVSVIAADSEAPRINFELNSWHYGALLGTGWLLIVSNFYRLVSSREDNSVYARWKIFDENLNPYTKRYQSPESSTKVSTWLYERCVLTTPRYHEGSRYRLIQLLQRGVGSVPAELQAICCVVLAIAAWLMMRPDGTEVVADPIASMPLIFAIAACLIPGIFASASLMHHRFHLSKQVLLPLKRKRLIDGKLLTVAWNTLLLWLSLGLVTLVTVWDFPGLQFNVPFVISFLVLSLSIAVVQFAVGMSIALSKSNFAQQTTFVIFPLGELVTVAYWWFQRDAVTDLPFIVLAGFALMFSTVAIESTRRAWMEVEVGRDHV